jgi:hypothetical protein
MPKWIVRMLCLIRLKKSVPEKTNSEKLSDLFDALFDEAARNSSPASSKYARNRPVTFPERNRNSPSRLRKLAGRERHLKYTVDEIFSGWVQATEDE